MITTVTKSNTQDWERLVRTNGLPNETKTDAIRIKGDPSLLVGCEADKHPKIAITGTYGLSSYGHHALASILTFLAQQNPKPVIVSGLDPGDNTTVFNTALKLGLPTVAVLPCGLEKVNMLNQDQLIKGIQSSLTKGCCIVSQFPDDTKPSIMRATYRNQFLSHIARTAMVVIETTRIDFFIYTAQQANLNGTPVFAVPGRMDDDKSAGCNELIRKGDAFILDKPEAILTKIEKWVTE